MRPVYVCQFGNRITAIADDSNGGKVQWRKPGKHSGQQEKLPII